MNNKGFTLVELLAVVVILSALSLIAVGSIMSSLERRENRECDEQKALAENAAKVYFSLKDGNEVTISTLVSEGYLDAKKVTKLNGSIILSDAQFTYNGECN